MVKLKKKKDNKLVILAMISGFFVGILFINTVSTVNFDEIWNNSILTPETSTEPISIDGDNWLSSGVAIGSGTMVDPYIIANLTLIGDGSAWSNGISIINSHVYGIIRNVNISNFYYGISIDNSSNIKIEYCSFNSSGNIGIFLYSSNFCNLTNNMATNSSNVDIELQASNNSIIQDNVLKNSHDGIHIRHSTENLIRKNLMYNNTGSGITIEDSTICSVEENSMDTNNFSGINLFGSNNTIVNDNNITNILYSGIRISRAYNCTIRDNIIDHNSGDGIDVGYSYANSIFNNSISYNYRYGISFTTDTSSNEAMENILIKNYQGSIRDTGSIDSLNNWHDNTIIELLDVSFTVSESEYTTNVPVNFTDTSLGGLFPLTYDWDFGDGDTSNEQNPSHVYTVPGEYLVNLTVTDSDGDNRTFTKTLYINEEEEENPFNIPGYSPATLFGVAVSIIVATTLKTKHKFSFQV